MAKTAGTGRSEGRSWYIPTLVLIATLVGLGFSGAPYSEPIGFFAFVLWVVFTAWWDTRDDHIGMHPERQTGDDASSPSDWIGSDSCG